MKAIIEIILAAILISFLVFVGSAFYFGTFDLMDLSADRRMDIIGMWIVIFLVWCFFFKSED